MAGPNPLVALGNLNRLRGTIIFPDHPELNISAPYLGKEGLRLSFEGNFADMLPQMAGMVISPVPFVKANLTVSLVKTTPLANAYKAQWESDATLGDLTFRSDASQLDPFGFVNSAIEGVDGLDASGTNANVTLRLSATYYINNTLWNL